MSRSGGGSSYRRPAVKVVIINTQYIETDSTSFKSVVQRLTGKDAIVEAKPTSQVVVAANSSRVMLHGGGPAPGDHDHQVEKSSSNIINNNNNSVLLRGLSFKDFDKLLMELSSPFDEIFQMIVD